MKRARAARSQPAPSAPPRGERAVPRGLLLVAPLLSGAAIMGLELVGLRLLAPRFGASTYVWGGLLGTIMAALAVGYLLGGALADRRPRPGWVFGLLLASAAWVAGDLLRRLPSRLREEPGSDIRRVRSGDRVAVLALGRVVLQDHGLQSSFFSARYCHRRSAI